MILFNAFSNAKSEIKQKRHSTTIVMSGWWTGKIGTVKFRLFDPEESSTCSFHLTKHEVQYVYMGVSVPLIPC